MPVRNGMYANVWYFNQCDIRTGKCYRNWIGQRRMPMIQQQNTMTYDITSDDMEYNGMESKLTVQANNVGRCYCYIEMEYLLTCDVSTKAKQCMEIPFHQREVIEISHQIFQTEKYYWPITDGTSSNVWCFGQGETMQQRNTMTLKIQWHGIQINSPIQQCKKMLRRNDQKFTVFNISRCTQSDV